MDIAIPPTLVAALSQGGTPPVLKPGDVVTARVLQILADGMARLSLANMIVDLPTEIALNPGTTIQLAVAGTPDNLKLALVEPAAQTAGPAKGQGVAPAQPTGAAPAPPADGASVRTEAAVALTAALRSAAVRQNGLAPLFADLTAAVEQGSLPQPVRQAVTRLLGFQIPANTVSAADVKQAFARSGVFLEAQLAATAATAPVGSGAASPAPPNDLKAALLVFRHVLKTWIDGAPEAEPEGVAKSLAVNVPGGTVAPATTKPSPVQVAAAAEAAAQGRVSAAVPVPGAPIGELPAADGRMVSRMLPLPAAALVRPAGLPPPPGEAVPPLPPGSASPPQAAPEKPAPASVPNPALPAPPPYRGGPLAAQPPAAPSILPEAGPRVLGERLLEETEAAISRQTLLQAASLPDGGRARDVQTPRWNFEIPLATPQGTAIAQFEIARDGRGNASNDRSVPVWRVRFTLDVEPIGPVHAQIALAGGKTSVALWAERAASAVGLRRDAGLLSAALREAELEPGEVLVRIGEPPRPPEPGAGRFLDRAS